MTAALGSEFIHLNENKLRIMFDPSSLDPISNVSELTEEIRQLTVKHNQLVESIALLWLEVQRTTSDLLTRQLCQRRLEELASMIHKIDRNTETPNGDKAAWD